MKKFRGPDERVANAIKLFGRGILGPSAMWLGIADLLTADTVVGVLDSLPPEIKDHLHAAWVGRPPHAFIARFPLAPGEQEFQAVCVQIVRWCEMNFPPQVLPDEPDGHIRVRSAGDYVQEWRPWDAPPEDAAK